MKIYDLIIIGSGPAGITAGIYAKNFGLDALIVGKEPGGLINTAFKVENYPGIFNISGKDLTKKFEEHRKYLKIDLKKQRVENIKKLKDIFKVFTEKQEYLCKSLILAFGTETRKLNINDKFDGKGVEYNASGNFKNKIVGVVGGANSAVMSAISLSKEAKKVYLIYRKDKLRADDIWVQRVKKIKNIEILYKNNVIDLIGEKKLKKIVLQDKELKVDNLIIEAGYTPNTYLINELGIKTDEKGYINVNEKQATNISGVFAAGDITDASNEFRQITTATAEASVAVLGVFNFLKT
ncbi:FAD-dependent oxidoreductase [Patescibacteria group bacterium]|nr:FAD-dependent oxidoreductase [Patescibacteria group bacterium]